jgi:sensor histidine kinase YesM
MQDHPRITRKFRSLLTDQMIFRNRWRQHLQFWVIAWIILFNIFKSSSSVEWIDILYTSIFMIPLALIVYPNLYIFLPRFLRHERYLLYLLSLLFLTVLGAVLLYYLFDRWIDLVLPGYYFISYNELSVLMLYTGSFLIVTTLLKLSRSWFLLMRMARTSNAQRLESLQSQINPHFLLNSLQTIYALSLEKSDRTPEVILQLSEVLKYSLYDTDQPVVKLDKEIRMIRDYVDMYRHRIDPVHAEILLEVKGDTEEGEIAPMLLLPFIENAFKHGLRGSADKPRVQISLEIAQQGLRFQVINSHGKSDEVDLEPTKGIGIENTRQRLNLLYPGKHQLEIEEKADTFAVKLTLELKK